MAISSIRGGASDPGRNGRIAAREGAGRRRGTSLRRLIQIGLIVAAFGLLLLVTVFPIRADAGGLRAPVLDISQS